MRSNDIVDFLLLRMQLINIFFSFTYLIDLGAIPNNRDIH